jgi:hypothetical protein
MAKTPKISLPKNWSAPFGSVDRRPFRPNPHGPKWLRRAPKSEVLVWVLFNLPGFAAICIDLHYGEFLREVWRPEAIVLAGIEMDCQGALFGAH